MSTPCAAMDFGSVAVMRIRQARSRSLAGAAFFPALVLGIFWKPANKAGAISGMVIGLKFYILWEEHMSSIELQAITIMRALVEVAGIFLLAQGVLFLLAGGTRDKNIVYQLFRIITRPVISGTRFISPKVIVDKHIPFVAFFLLFWLWILLAYVRRVVCELNGLVCGATGL